ncbi:MAG: signal peptidase I [Planctomycetes bacterium GWF2_41_51]|nr:MAG: signal peptidase I [Planctomycetes bacterium GWF2_41_51]HBG28373.1 signal peptidase I [Phycisphaerales bacterium]
MAETTNINKRHTWVAVMLSLIAPGLGQVYCGKLIRGLLFIVLNTLPISLIMFVFLFKNLTVMVLGTIGLIVFGGIILIIALVDSIYLVKNIGANYVPKEYNRWYVYLLLILIGGGGGTGGSTFYVKSNIVEAFRVPANSMYPTIKNGDRFLADKTIYKKIDPSRGDVVVYINPENRLNYIKRVVAIEGDTVEMKNNQLYVNGRMLEYQPLSKTELETLRINTGNPKFQGEVFYEVNGSSKYAIFLSKSPANEQMQNFQEMTVPKYNCFVLGDNRNESHDSRNSGPIPIATIKGKANWIYFPISHFGKIE